MKGTLYILMLAGLITGCRTDTKKQAGPPASADSVFTIAFGSCNRSRLPNELWDDVLAARPDLWVWGGDIVYADTDSIPLLREFYARQDTVSGYRVLRDSVRILGTWDDHDYGLNDGGAEFKAREGSKQAFLDFMKVPRESPRRNRDGVYHAETIRWDGGSIRVLLLDTRFNRTPLLSDPSGARRYIPQTDPGATFLGGPQWAWLEEELGNSTADFNIVVSSIQVLSDQHGFEAWGNMPGERERLLHLIATSGARGVILLSGDRHISEFSRLDEWEGGYPLVDFTSSGLTHVYSSFTGEPNPYRVGEVVSRKSFGLLRLHSRGESAEMEIVADGGEVLGSLIQRY